jgi:hypothetical protein
LLRLLFPFFHAPGFAPKYLRPNQPIVIGYALRDLFTCEKGVPPSDETCVSDNYETYHLGNIPLPVRKGNHAKATITLVKFDRVTIFTIPGELAPEIANGLPADFDQPEGVAKYYQKPEHHAVGAAYTLPGVLKDMLRCDYCWAFGLTSDAAGYIFPISDWRVGCFGPYCEGEDYITGETCQKIIESGDEEGRLSCLFGAEGSLLLSSKRLCFFLFSPAYFSSNFFSPLLRAFPFVVVFFFF